MTRLQLSKGLLLSAAERVDRAIKALDEGDPRTAGELVYAARGILGQVKTALEDELHLVRIRLEAEETSRLKRQAIKGGPR